MVYYSLFNNKTKEAIKKTFNIIFKISKEAL